MEIHFSGKCDVMRAELYHRLPFDPDSASKAYRRLDRGRIKVQLKIAKMNPRPALPDKERKPYTRPLRGSVMMN